MKPSTIGIVLFFSFVTVNLGLINYRLFFHQTPQSEPNSTVRMIPSPSLESDNQSTIEANLGKIIPTRSASREAERTTPQPSTAQFPPTATAFPKKPQEYSITLGTGSSTNTEWATITTAQAWIDQAQYSTIQKTEFEVAVSAPKNDQIVSVRLYNVTDQYVVGRSELTFEHAIEPKLLISAPITLGSGNKLYAVQMKTQLGYTAQIDVARIRISAQ